MKGQSEIITAVLLISVVLVLSVSFLSYAASLMSQKTTESELNNFLQTETANIFIYKENSVGSVIYLGVIRIDGTSSTYYYLAVNGTKCYPNGLISSDGYPEGYLSSVWRTSSSSIYILTSDGTYVQLSSFPGFKQASIPLHRLDHDGGNVLLKIDLTNVGRGAGGGNCLAIIFFTPVNNNYYEVGRYYEVYGGT